MAVFSHPVIVFANYSCYEQRPDFYLAIFTIIRIDLNHSGIKIIFKLSLSIYLNANMK